MGRISRGQRARHARQTNSFFDQLAGSSTAESSRQTPPPPPPPPPPTPTDPITTLPTLAEEDEEVEAAFESVDVSPETRAVVREIVSPASLEVQLKICSVLTQNSVPGRQRRTRHLRHLQR